MEETMPLRDESAEDAVLCGVLHEPEVMFAELAKIKLTEADFTFHKQMTAYMTMRNLWTRGKRVTLLSSWIELQRDKDFGGWRALAQWLCDTYHVAWWDAEIGKFWIDGSRLVTGYGCRGLAAAAKVKWLSARRNAIHRAKIVIRDAVEGYDGPEHFEEYQ